MAAGPMPFLGGVGLKQDEVFYVGRCARQGADHGPKSCTQVSSTPCWPLLVYRHRCKRFLSRQLVQGAACTPAGRRQNSGNVPTSSTGPWSSGRFLQSHRVGPLCSGDAPYLDHECYYLGRQRPRAARKDRYYPRQVGTTPLSRGTSAISAKIYS